MDAQQLSQQLIHYIRNQNIEKVRQCLEHLSKTGFNPAKDEKILDPLQMAAFGKDLNILKAVYEFDPSLYDAIVANERLATPIFLAAHTVRLPIFQYLLSVRPIVSRDMTHLDKHILVAPAGSSKSKSYEMMRLLIAQGVGFDNEDKDTFSNPLAVISRAWGLNKLSNISNNMKKFALILPYANACSKYLGILSTTQELYYCYGHGPRTELHCTGYMSDRANILFDYRNQILASLTPKECDEIHTLFFSKHEPVCATAEEILLDDLLNFEVKLQPGSDVAANIRRCFARPEKIETPSVTTVSDTFFYHKQSPSGSKQQEESFCLII